MSYTRTMYGSVHWHTSGSVSYPASQYGGTMGYSDSGDIPVTINVHVDTNSFDSSAAICTASLGVLSGSVVATGKAQCDSITQSGHDISKHISDGFFSIVKSELSQNIAQLMSTLNSKIGLILSHSKQVQKTRSTMESDYNRYLARYTKVFSQLNEECAKRVKVLDKQAYSLSQEIMQKRLCSDTLDSQAAVLTNSNDIALAKQKMATSRLKSATSCVIDVLLQNAQQEKRYSSGISRILRDFSPNGHASDSYSTLLYVPNILVQSVSVEKNTPQQDIYTSDILGDASGVIKQKIFAYTQDATLDNPPAKKEDKKNKTAQYDPRVKAAFSRLMENFASQDISTEEDRLCKQRVCAEIASLTSELF